MKRISFLIGLLVVLFAFIGCSNQQAEKVEAPDDSNAMNAKLVKVGEAITVAEVTPLTELLTSPAKYVGQTLLIEGKVNGRCQGTGCWVSLETGDSTSTFYVKSPDHSFVF